MHVRYSLRFILALTTIYALVSAFQTYIVRIVIPDNVNTASTICKTIGAEYERTGQYPRGSLLKWSDIRQNYGLAIREAANTGYTENKTDTLDPRSDRTLKILE